MDVATVGSPSKSAGTSLTVHEETSMTHDLGGDIRESEMDVYENKSYVELRNGNQVVKISEDSFTCPYCPKKSKQDYLYRDIVQHAFAVGRSTSEKRSMKEKANHLALVKYLEKDLAATGSPSKPVGESDPLSGGSHDEKFVWPCTGIAINLPTSRAEDGRYVGASGSKFRDELINRGLNPSRVIPLWNFRGHLGSAIVEFGKSWSGLHDAISFEKAYESDHHGKKDWLINNGKKCGVYCWVARGDDYNSNDEIGKHLQKNRDLKTVSELMEEEARKQDQLVSDLTKMFEIKNKHLQEMELRCSETSIIINKLIEENDKATQAHNAEILNIQLDAKKYLEKIFNNHEKLNSEIESQKKELEMHDLELKKREAKNQSSRRQLSEEIGKNAIKNRLLQLATLEQHRNDQNILKLAEYQKRQTNELHNRIIQLEKQLDAKQALELEIEQLRGTVNVMKHIGADGDAEVLAKMQKFWLRCRRSG